jgi:transcriptional regulator with XRE-family HTH domain
MSKKNIYAKIGTIIREFRENYKGKGISQEELAKAIDVQPNTISRWETATYKIKISDLEKLANFFSVSISQFFPEEYANAEASDLRATLLSATADLHEDDIKALTEFAEFRRMRKVLEKASDE